MTYQIIVPKIHCSGCVNLIKMSLAEIFENVKVDQDFKVVEFESGKELDEVKEELDKVFEELKESGYEYINFKKKD
jgi:copper chaperone CopZ